MQEKTKINIRIAEIKKRINLDLLSDPLCKNIQKAEQDKMMRKYKRK